MPGVPNWTEFEMHAHAVLERIDASTNGMQSNVRSDGFAKYAGSG